MPRPAWVVLLLLLTSLAACASAPAKSSSPSSPSSPSSSTTAADGLLRPAGPQEALALIRKIESDPFRQDDPFRAEVAGLVRWVEEAPNITVELCEGMFPQVDIDKWPPQAVLFGQLMLAQAGYLIEHPGAPSESEAVYTAGVTGAIHAYRKLLAAHADERQAGWDEVDAAERAGRLGPIVRQGMQACAKASSK